MSNSESFNRPLETDKLAEQRIEDARLRDMFEQRLKAYRNKENKLETVYSDELEIGMEVSETVEVTEDLITAFAVFSEDVNPIHVDDEYAKGTRFHERILHGAYSLNVISKLLGTRLPGVGTIFGGLTDLNFHAPVKVGDTLTTYVKVAAIGEKGKVTFDVGAKVGNVDVVTAKAFVIAPRKKIEPNQSRPES